MVGLKVKMVGRVRASSWRAYSPMPPKRTCQRSICRWSAEGLWAGVCVETWEGEERGIAGRMGAVGGVMGMAGRMG